MGLDVTAYSDLSLVTKNMRGEEAKDPDLIRIDFTECSEWAGRASPIERGIYEGYEAMRFRAGSYTGPLMR